MKKLGIAAVVAAGLGAAVMGLSAPAYAAPEGNTTSQLDAPGSGTPRAGADTAMKITTRTAYLVFS
jgi:hypothetical protein